MTQQLVWEDPPEAVSYLESAVTKLRENPGQWARVNVSVSMNAGYAQASRYRVKYSDCEFRCKNNDGQAVVYGRCVTLLTAS